MYRTATLIAVILVLTALAVSSWAYPSLNPWTGTGSLPTAELQKPGTADLAVDFHDDEIHDDYYDLGLDYNGVPIRLVYGVNHRLELGAGFVSDYSDTWRFAAKYQLQADESGSVAVGAFYSHADAFDYYWFDWYDYPDLISVPEMTEYNLYVARTFSVGKPQPEGVAHKITIGANWTMVSRDMSSWGDDYEDYEEGAFRLFASWQARYGRGSLAVDYQSGDTTIEAAPMWSAVTRYDISPTVKAEIGYGNSSGVLGSFDSRFFGGLCFTLGK